LIYLFDEIKFLAIMMQMDFEPIDLDLLQRHPEV